MSVSSLRLVNKGPNNKKKNLVRSSSKKSVKNNSFYEPCLIIDLSTII